MAHLSKGGHLEYWSVLFAWPLNSAIEKTQRKATKLASILWVICCWERLSLFNLKRRVRRNWIKGCNLNQPRALYCSKTRV